MDTMKSGKPDDPNEKKSPPAAVAEPTGSAKPPPSASTDSTSTPLDTDEGASPSTPESDSDTDEFPPADILTALRKDLKDLSDLMNNEKKIAARVNLQTKPEEISANDKDDSLDLRAKIHKLQGEINAKLGAVKNNPSDFAKVKDDLAKRGLKLDDKSDHIVIDSPYSPNSEKLLNLPSLVQPVAVKSAGVAAPASASAPAGTPSASAPAAVAAGKEDEQKNVVEPAAGRLLDYAALSEEAKNIKKAAADAASTTAANAATKPAEAKPRPVAKAGAVRSPVRFMQDLAQNAKKRIDEIRKGNAASNASVAPSVASESVTGQLSVAQANKWQKALSNADLETIRNETRAALVSHLNGLNITPDIKTSLVPSLSDGTINESLKISTPPKNSIQFESHSDQASSRVTTSNTSKENLDTMSLAIIKDFEGRIKKGQKGLRLTANCNPPSLNDEFSEMLNTRLKKMIEDGQKHPDPEVSKLFNEYEYDKLKLPVNPKSQNVEFKVGQAQAPEKPNDAPVAGSTATAPSVGSEQVAKGHEGKKSEAAPLTTATGASAPSASSPPPTGDEKEPKAGLASGLKH